VFQRNPDSNYWRFRISPTIEVATGLNVMDPEETGVGTTVEMLASRHPGASDRDAYDRVLSDAIVGDRTLFAREDYVEEAWRIVEPILAQPTPVYPYDRGNWGPKQLESLVPPGGWVDPKMS
jgi:glucose-6-phosphate 1-dehydrogenase